MFFAGGGGDQVQQCDACKGRRKGCGDGDVPFHRGVVALRRLCDKQQARRRIAGFVSQLRNADMVFVTGE